MNGNLKVTMVKDYLKILVEQIHSTTIATIAADGHPQTRVIDMMLWDENGVYFLTAKGKAFYCPWRRFADRCGKSGRSCCEVWWKHYQI